MSTITALIADSHLGAWTGLSLPQWDCDTGTLDQHGKKQVKTVLATPGQLWLLDRFNEFFEWVYLLCAEHKARLVVIHLGDVIDGLHHGNGAMSLPNIYDQEEMAKAIFEPIALKADKFYILRGTNVHAGNMAASEARIADHLGAQCLFEAVLNIDGTIIDVAHHGRAARRNWTSVAASIASQSIIEASTHKRPVPKYVFRAHNHIIDDSGAKVSGTRAFAMPSFCLRGEFGYHVAAGTTPDIGGVIMLPNGELDLSMIRFYGAPGDREVIVV